MVYYICAKSKSSHIRILNRFYQILKRNELQYFVICGEGRGKGKSGFEELHFIILISSISTKFYFNFVLILLQILKVIIIICVNKKDLIYPIFSVSIKSNCQNEMQNARPFKDFTTGGCTTLLHTCYNVLRMRSDSLRWCLGVWGFTNWSGLYFKSAFFLLRL